MFCSVIIPTIGRPTVSRAVVSALEQGFGDDSFEVVVVNDSGQTLSEARWQHDGRVRIIHTNQRERSVARNSGAAVARGEYLCFLDDDDWLLPGALAEMWDLAVQAKDAAWLYGGIRVMGEDGRCLAEINSGLRGQCLAQVMGGAWVPIQSSFIRSAAFFAVGGYDPSICGTEDQDLCRRIALRGRLANTPATIASLLRGDTWHTSTNYQRAAADTRRSRDVVLNEPGAFRQLLSSASSSYWYGRLLRVYLSTVNYNMRRGSWMTAASRALFGLMSLAMAGRHVFSLDYWRGARDAHVPGTLHFVMAEQEEKRDGSSSAVHE